MSAQQQRQQWQAPMQAQRAMSPSPKPSERPRNVKAQSLSLLPSQQHQQQQVQQQVLQQQQQAMQQQQHSPQLLPGQIQRSLPTPPNPRAASSSPPYATRPGQSPFMYQMTDQLLADIERADLEHSQMGGYYTARDKALEEQLGYSSKETSLERKVSATKSSSPKESSLREQVLRHSPGQAPGDVYHPLRRVNTSTHTPPLQTLSSTRSPDKSLPVQEEPEEHDWNGRNSRTGYREDEDGTLIDSDKSEGTPRSPSSALPEFSHQQHRGRTGTTDQLGLQGIDFALDSKPSDSIPILHAPKASSYQFYNAPSVYTDDMMDPTAYMQQFYRSPRPDAPIPPTPHSQTNPPSPSPLLSHAAPILPSGSPYPFPFGHVRRNLAYVPAAYDTTNITERMQRQYQVYAQNSLMRNETESMFSPSSTPVSHFNEWAQWHTQKILGQPSSQSITSSPSHEPIALPKPYAVGLKKGSSILRKESRKEVNGRKPPPRVESTQPRETSPELSESGESSQTAGEEDWQHEENGIAEDDDANWVDESDSDDLLELEYHPSYIRNVDKRRRRWECKWEALMQAFQDLDRQTDSTLILLAAPSHSKRFHIATSRSIRQSNTSLTSMKSSFKSLVQSHTRKLQPPASTQDLERALNAALASLGMMGEINEQREARWREEMQRLTDDRERVEGVLRQVMSENKGTV